MSMDIPYREGLKEVQYLGPKDVSLPLFNFLLLGFKVPEWTGTVSWMRVEGH